MSTKAHIVRVPLDAEGPSTPVSDLPRRADFSYSKNLFYTRLMLESILIILVAITISPLFLDLALTGTAIVLGLLIIYLLFSAVSPFLTSHTLTPEDLILRQGWYFRSTIPMEEIESIEETSEFVLMGVKFSITDRKVYVTGSKRNLVRIKLREQRRFFLALGKRASEVVIDVRNRSEFIELANRIMEVYQAPTPASPDQSS